MTQPTHRQSVLGAGRLPRLAAAWALIVLVAACSGVPSGKSDADQATDLLNAGLQAHVAGDLDGAKKDYEECLKHDAKNKFCLYNLGLITQTQGNPTEAETNYRLALAIDPNYAPAIFNLAIVRTQAGATDEAITLYRQFVGLLPDDASGHLNLGLLLRANGDEAGGDKEIEAAIKLDPSMANRLGSPAPSPS